MTTRNELLHNVCEYTPEEIADAIKSGKISFNELCKKSSDDFSPLLKSQVLAILKEDYDEFVRIKEESNIDENIQIAETPIKEEGTSDYDKVIRLFSFKGRIKRSEYALTFIIVFIVSKVINSYIDDQLQLDDWIALILVQIILTWINLAQGAKRCHDLGNSGWFQLMPFYFLWLIFSKGDARKNKYD